MVDAANAHAYAKPTMAGRGNVAYADYLLMVFPFLSIVNHVPSVHQ
jgi:hypothetical protein